MHQDICFLCTVDFVVVFPTISQTASKQVCFGGGCALSTSLFCCNGGEDMEVQLKSESLCSFAAGCQISRSGPVSGPQKPLMVRLPQEFFSIKGLFRPRPGQESNSSSEFQKIQKVLLLFMFT